MVDFSETRALNSSWAGDAMLQMLEEDKCIYPEDTPPALSRNVGDRWVERACYSPNEVTGM